MIWLRVAGFCYILFFILAVSFILDAALES